jgi:hypothetical protein
MYGWYYTYPKVDIGGFYNVNSDTLTDYGFIDFSTDMGSTWTRVDTSLGFCTWGAFEELPVFTGNSNGWKHFYYCIQVPFSVSVGDTILYKFTFISDSIQTNKDGLMFDDLHFEDWAEGVDEISNSSSISVFPNPVTDFLSVESITNSRKRLKLFDNISRELYTQIFTSSIVLNMKELKSGIYFYEIIDENGNIDKGKLIKE